MSGAQAEGPRVALKPLCNTHQALLVGQCQYGPQDPWKALLIATQIALFQGATCDPKVYAELNAQVERMPELGCLACRKPDLFGQLIDAVQRAPRDAHIRTIKELGEGWVDATNQGKGLPW